MEKVLKTITSCHECDMSVLFQNRDADFEVLACARLKCVLKEVHSEDDYNLDIPSNCPLPDFVKSKTD